MWFVEIPSRFGLDIRLESDNIVDRMSSRKG